MNESAQFRPASVGSTEFAEVAAVAELIRSVTVDYVEQHEDPVHAMAMLMTALPTVAGTHFASLLYVGALNKADQARMAKSCAHNFREGVKVGMKRADRVANATGFKGTVQ